MASWDGNGRTRTRVRWDRVVAYVSILIFCVLVWWGLGRGLWWLAGVLL